jgi:4-diphosphocytidyl-2-C-methyl-D-erythritol kinase
MMRLFSPAKLNLFFRVLRKREDGYHEIASLFQTIGLGDILSIEKANCDQMTCDRSDLACDASNLVMRAVALFRKKMGSSLCVKVHLQKRIPMQAGLGGGSSNAATTLWALNELCGKVVSRPQLQEWSLELGSDVPFFFSLGTAYCQGRGEVIREMPSLKETMCWIAKPEESLSTALVYQHVAPDERANGDLEHDLESFYGGNGHFFNDLEKPAFKLIPDLEFFKKKLQKCGFERVFMTGSGTAFFCLGNPSAPLPEGTSFFEAPFIRRESQQWYEGSIV